MEREVFSKDDCVWELLCCFCNFACDFFDCGRPWGMEKWRSLQASLILIPRASTIFRGFSQSLAHSLQLVLLLPKDTVRRRSLFSRS